MTTKPSADPHGAMPTDHIKSCVDCRHVIVRRSWFSGFLLKMPSSYLCGLVIDLVKGEPIGISCSTMRAPDRSETSCGPEARFFEPRHRFSREPPLPKTGLVE